MREFTPPFKILKSPIFIFGGEEGAWMYRGKAEILYVSLVQLQGIMTRLDAEKMFELAAW